jgi:CheY-like chemotaxis protein
MPILNGEYVFEYIDNYYKNENTNTEFILKNIQKPYIIAITAYFDRGKYLKLGFDSYIAKPVSKKQIDIEFQKFHLINS